MKFNYLELQDLNQAFPNKIDNSNSIIKNEQYMKLYNTYRCFFSQYFIELLGLKNADEDIKKSGLNFYKISKKNMDIFQYFTCEEMGYIYLRNNIYIERLDSLELDFLSKYNLSENLKLDDQMANFIKNTFQKVIFEDLIGDGKITNISYGSDAIQYYVKNNSFVIGIRHDEFFKDGLSDEEWFIQHKKKREFLNKFIKNKEEFFKTLITDVPVKILQYNKFSVNIAKKS